MDDKSSGNAESTNPTPIDAWRKYLEGELTQIKTDPGNKRAWTFDMDDQMELSTELLNAFPVLKQSLEFLQDRLRPDCKEADDDALRAQASRRKIAWLAIWPGIIAILLAILQLVLSHLFPRLTAMVTGMEVVSVVLAAVAVFMGIGLHFHHRWLSRRQIAERLRSLKFQSLGWHDLWCNTKSWEERVIAEVSKLKALTTHDAEQWAVATDDVVHQPVLDPGCTIEANDLRALADYYRVKRLLYQQAYFDRQAKKADIHSWATRWKMSLIIFSASVIIVLMHGVLAVFGFLTDKGEHGAAGHNDHYGLHQIEIVLVGLAALLPVLGFGFRAWSAAFEFPRSRNLFRAKSHALNMSIQGIDEDAHDLLKTMNHISVSEHFFLGEHREWCRLQMESEWYV